MDFLTNPFTTALLLLYQFLGQNIVLSIVVFTLLTRLLTFPLTYQQIKSSKAMQELQPKMKKLQEKYKNDREKLAQEQMRLYREHGINPLAGCLPLLIQFPILIGLYGAIGRVLAATPLQLLDLNHRLLIPSLSSLVPMQNTFLWLNLGQPDPLYVLPVLVVATTWLQQKLMTPPTASADPNDPSAAMSRNMMVMMPLMIGMFSLQFASGLSIYWIVSNLAGILQYAAMGKVNVGNLIGRPSVSAPVEDDEPEEPTQSKKKRSAELDPSTAIAIKAVEKTTQPKKKKSGPSTSGKAKTSKAK
jgi:YidC/Oxa1 family membrane protein insertase